MINFGLNNSDIHLIEKKTLSSDVNIVHFSVLGNYKSFMFIIMGEIDNGNTDNIYLFLNDDTTLTNYYSQLCQFYAAGSNIARNNSPLLAQIATNANIFIRGYINQLYSNKAFFESTYNFDDGANIRQAHTLCDWVTLNPITKISFKSNAEKFKTGSVFVLYGIR
jgi:hypothetical protein